MISAPRASATWRPSASSSSSAGPIRVPPSASGTHSESASSARSTSGVSSARVTRVSRVPNVNASARSVERTTAWAKRSRSGLCARSEPETSISSEHPPRPPRPLAPGELQHLAARPVRGVEHALQVELAARAAPAARAGRSPPAACPRAPPAAPRARRAPSARRRAGTSAGCAGRPGCVQPGALARLERLELPLVAGVRRGGLALVVVGRRRLRLLDEQVPAAEPARRRRRRRPRSPPPARRA